MRALMMKGWLAAVALGAPLLLTGCGPEQVNLEGKTMGTAYSIRYVTGDDTPSAREMQAEIDRRLEQVNAQMSTYRPDSELSRFNASRAVDEPFPVSPATAEVVLEALRINRVTDGALDVTVGPLVNLWGFGPEGRPDKVPSAAALEQRRAWTGADKLSVRGNALVKSIPELYVDLSSIAKGYGVDVIAGYLQSQRVKNYMVDIGGEVRTRGHNGEQKPWRIAIERPAAGAQQRAQLVIQPGEMSIATSGDYRNYFEQDGVRYSHTIDPITGRPIHHRLVSITVLSPTCMTADGLSTGLNVLGPERGMALANLLGIPVFMIVKTTDGFEERYSDAFKPYLKKRS
ncbi:FAD:protein FMN transferase [Serratia entomophila]|uniref:FAD:protein FMN transferase n=1 Tax=Serratia entomophila TaxID=42906 RepID=UPI00217ACFB3|nr:FAD:protein FMN transferase [Serratia entomophila]CAI0953163.1 Thiamine biosynthesis lipoprotein ApbE precursor [Serratia entomophila]CAI0956331.1 Thiamine biosynthesis lipoprotein ApbE precursor [Serratia entomophila]CAI1640091.1 Thiamine biosynthesis lipoprotein ApbE precursor [Serratia entomophila]CAI1778970.1 Thiamine biosynthesis lipoprotein ApbE precursor [Serratia entomophila]CAI1789431.1 Thiamine biosynthesis lipoprotein ApbE precursor [Serratia entomophila]